MRNNKKRLNALDITVISVLLTIIVFTAVIPLKDSGKPKIEIELGFESESCREEVFSEIYNGAQVFDLSSGENLGTISSLKINQIENGSAAITFSAKALADKVENGILINNTKFYKGQKLNVTIENSCITVTLTALLRQPPASQG